MTLLTFLELSLISPFWATSIRSINWVSPLLLIAFILVMIVVNDGLNRFPLLALLVRQLNRKCGRMLILRTSLLLLAHALFVIVFDTL